MKPINKLEISIITIFVLIASFVVQGSLDNESLSELLDGEIKKVVTQQNKQIVIAGSFSKSKLIRINSDRTIDWEFTEKMAQSGMNSEIRALANQENQLIIGGEFTHIGQSLVGYIAKLDAEGNLDTNFVKNSGVGFDDRVNEIIVQPDGKYVILGDFTSYNGEKAPHIARLFPDGKFDSSFQVDSGFDQAPHFAKLSHDGKILYVSGPFRSYQNKNMPYLAKISLDSGRLHQ
ncbi:MAG: delta-60 repeat domain-containing protein [Bdellovibrionales bacterium]|nr:delta-60 repeat domain-containing protein [Bdellovibrionales bacterium]